MIEEREFRGQWWIPDETETPIGGGATFSQEEGVQLELFSAFNQSIEDTFSQESVEYDVILGHSTDNDLITIRDARRTGTSSSIGPQASAKTETYAGQEMFIGRHFVDDIEFDQINLKYPLLYDWAGLSGVTHRIDRCDNCGDETHEIEYEPPSAITAELDDADLRLKTGGVISRGDGISIEEETHFNIKRDDEMLTFEESREYLSRMWDFMSLATGAEIHPVSFVGRIETEPPEIDGETLGRTFDNVEILYPTGRDTNQPGSQHPMRTNFEFSDIEDRFKTVMNDWFEKYEDLNPVIRLYFLVGFRPI